jgi:uncharacterized protein
MKEINDNLLYAYGRNDELHLTILPTENCNFRCTYCYEKHINNMMTNDVIMSILKFLQKRGPEISFLTLSWFGGEPLLGFKVIKQIMSYINDEMPHPKNFRFASGMTTNGYLLNKGRLNDLVSLGVRGYQISLDGDIDMHDKFRVLIGNLPTFNVIYNNLIGAHRTDLNFNFRVRLHVNKNNYESLSKLISRLRNDLDGDERYVLFIRNLSRLGGPNDKNLPVIEENDESVVKLANMAKNLGFKVDTLQDADRYVCYASRLNGFTIMPDGRLVRCTVALYDEKNIIGKLNTDGSLDIDREKALWWSRGLFSGNPDELACPLRTMSVPHK